MLGVPILFHIFGITYASVTHNQEVGFTSAYLMFLLYVNSLIMLMVYFIMEYKKNKEVN